MRLFPIPLAIGDNEGFTAEKDIFGRADYGQKMMLLIEKIDDPIVAILDGAWGSGKTTFAKMWCGLLRNNNFPVVYLDAFASDYLNDAFCMILSGFFSEYQKISVDVDSSEKFISSAKKMLKIVAKIGAKAGVRLITSNLISKSDIDELENAKDAICNAAEIEVDKAFESIIANGDEKSNTLINFKKMISEFPTAYRNFKNENGNDAEIKPLVFVVDELDRCNPKFSIEVLECIKHFFSVDNVHFILVTNSVQIEDSIRNIYGTSSPEIYLHKFYNLRFALPNLQRIPNADNVDRYVKYLSANFPQETKDPTLTKHTLQLIKEMAKQLNLSFREIEKLMSEFAIFLHSINRGFIYVSYIASVLCVLKVVDYQLYKKIVDKKALHEELLEFINKFNDIYHYDEIHRWWNYVFSTDNDSERFPDQVRHLSRVWNTSKDRILPIHCEYFDAFSFVQSVRAE